MDRKKHWQMESSSSAAGIDESRKYCEDLNRPPKEDRNSPKGRIMKRGNMTGSGLNTITVGNILATRELSEQYSQISYVKLEPF